MPSSAFKARRSAAERGPRNCFDTSWEAEANAPPEGISKIIKTAFRVALISILRYVFDVHILHTSVS